VTWLLEVAALSLFALSLTAALLPLLHLFLRGPAP
jgi:hypothetical protein